MKETVHEILRAAALEIDTPAPEPLDERVARRFVGLGSSNEDWELRGQAARAADLDH